MSDGGAVEDLYAVLGLARGAPPGEVKRAYHQLASAFHPDHHAQGTPAEQAVAAAAIQRVNEAYSVLSDPQTREWYLLYGAQGVRAGLELATRYSGKWNKESLEAELNRQKSAEAQRRWEAKINHRSTSIFGFSAAHLINPPPARPGAPPRRSRGLDLLMASVQQSVSLPLSPADALTLSTSLSTQFAGRGGTQAAVEATFRRQVATDTSLEATAALGSERTHIAIGLTQELWGATTATSTLSLQPSGGPATTFHVQTQLDAASAGYAELALLGLDDSSLVIGYNTAGKRWRASAKASLAPSDAGLEVSAGCVLAPRYWGRARARVGLTAALAELGVTYRSSETDVWGASLGVTPRAVVTTVTFERAGHAFRFPVTLSAHADWRVWLAAAVMPATAGLALRRFVLHPLRARAYRTRLLAARNAAATISVGDRAIAAGTQAMLSGVMATRAGAAGAAAGAVEILEARYGVIDPDAWSLKLWAPIRGGGRGTAGNTGDAWESPHADDDDDDGGGEDEGSRAAKQRATGTGAMRREAHAAAEAVAAAAGLPPLWVDVTPATRFLASGSGRLDLASDVARHTLLGFCDPCPGEPKQLFVRYRVAGEGMEREVTVPDGVEVHLPPPRRGAAAE